jgi:nicotinamidase/pyrazinamidase
MVGRMNAGCALLIVDIQNDFLPGGALAVPAGDQVIPAVNRLALHFDKVILTQDWHAPGHISFASSHPGRQPFSTRTCRTARRCCGPITACRAHPAPALPTSWRYRRHRR